MTVSKLATALNEIRIVDYLVANGLDDLIADWRAMRAYIVDDANRLRHNEIEAAEMLRTLRLKP